MLGRERRERGRREKQTDREGEGRSEKQKRERERGGITGVFINRSTHTCNNVNVGTLECIRGNNYEEKTRCERRWRETKKTATNKKKQPKSHTIIITLRDRHEPLSE